MTERPGTTAVVLCGGLATRLGGVEKPLVDLAGKPLLAHVIDRLLGQVDAIVLSVGSDPESYRHFGYPVVPDEQPGEGPLAGIVSARIAVQTPWLLTTPADTPFLPAGLVDCLSFPCHRRGAAVASAGGRRQNLAMLLDERKATSLAEFYESGGRAVHRWLVANKVDEVRFPVDAFFNVNTPDELARAHAMVEGRPG